MPYDHDHDGPYVTFEQAYEIIDMCTIFYFRDILIHIKK